MDHDIESRTLYPFRYFDPLRKRWLTARYVATREDIAARYERWEIIGPGEVRAPNGQFMPPG
jgi:hypothetical protein